MRDRETRQERAVSSTESVPSSIDGKVETPNGSGSRREIPIWLIGSLGLAIGLGVTLRIMHPYGFGPAIFVGFGRDDRPSQSAYVRASLGEDVTIRRDFAHDGKFFFPEANDPWYLVPEVHVGLPDGASAPDPGRADG